MRNLFENGAAVAAAPPKVKQLATFHVADRFYGIDVIQVQEIAKALPLTPIHLSAPYVAGLINLRGQIATAIDLRKLFQLANAPAGEKMSVICKLEGGLVSLLVDEIGDVLELAESDFEPTPETVPEATRRFLSGVYKTPHSILSIIDISNLSTFLSK
ncbi:MAG: chemotaxis protein CheW [Proteobacteria bacterium]|nr:MAG: chemotaxis protein CheW [Pseudomonadota bacterium]